MDEAAQVAAVARCSRASSTSSTRVRHARRRSSSRVSHAEARARAGSTRARAAARARAGRRAARAPRSRPRSADQRAAPSACARPKPPPCRSREGGDGEVRVAALASGPRSPAQVGVAEQQRPGRRLALGERRAPGPCRARQAQDPRAGRLGAGGRPVARAVVGDEDLGAREPRRRPRRSRRSAPPRRAPRRGSVTAQPLGWAARCDRRQRPVLGGRLDAVRCPAVARRREQRERERGRAACRRRRPSTRPRAAKSGRGARDAPRSTPTARRRRRGEPAYRPCRNRAVAPPAAATGGRRRRPSTAGAALPAAPRTISGASAFQSGVCAADELLAELAADAPRCRLRPRAPAARARRE